MTAPTAGFGLGGPNPRAASSNARRMNASSFSLVLRRHQGSINYREAHLARETDVLPRTGKFLRSGIAMPQAVEALLPDSPRGAIREPSAAAEDFRASESVAGAFTRLQPVIGEMEATMIGSSSDSGRLDVTFKYLAGYFGTLHDVRSSVLGQLSWPVIQLHIAVFVVSAPTALIVGPGAYVYACAKAFALIYGVGAAAFFVVWTIMRLAQTSAGVDAALRFLPLVGNLRRNFALSRFCATFEMQLQAGINVMNSLTAAAQASHSRMLQADVARAVPQILNGAQVAEALSDARSMPASFRRVLRIGEDTGTLNRSSPMGGVLSDGGGRQPEADHALVATDRLPPDLRVPRGRDLHDVNANVLAPIDTLLKE